MNRRNDMLLGGSSRRRTLGRTVAFGMLVVLACVWIGTAAAHAASAGVAEKTAQAHQACADRWAWMRFSADRVYVSKPTRARVTFPGVCKVTVQYGESFDGGFSVFPCEVNSFGAYACAGHAHYQVPASTRWNATTTTGGRLVLDDPPRTKPRTSRPTWTRRYTVIDGYIRPFGPNGRLRRGLKLVGEPRGVGGCGVGRARSTVLICVTGYTCFVAKLPLHAGDHLACPEAPGSKRFRRGRALR